MTKHTITIDGKECELRPLVYLGTYRNIRKALNTLFPGKKAYLDDLDIVFDSESSATQGWIDVKEKGWWTVTMLDGTTHKVKVPGACVDN